MAFDKREIMLLDTEAKRQLAFELLDSIDEDYIHKEIPEWKKQLVRERIKADDEQHNNIISWNEMKKEYDNNKFQ